MNSIDQPGLLEKCPKIQEDSVTLVLTFHPALYIIPDILKFVHRIIENSPTLKAILLKPPHIVFCNPNTLRDELVLPELRADYEEETDVFICGRRNCNICKIVEPGMNLKVQPLGKYMK